MIVCNCCEKVIKRFGPTVNQIPLSQDLLVRPWSSNGLGPPAALVLQQPWSSRSPGSLGPLGLPAVLIFERSWPSSLGLPRCSLRWHSRCLPPVVSRKSLHLGSPRNSWVHYLPWNLCSLARNPHKTGWSTLSKEVLSEQYIYRQTIAQLDDTP